MHKVDNNLMNPKITSYYVFIHDHRVGPHAPQFDNIDDAENFANSMRAITQCVVSEPVPMLMTEEVKTKLNTGD